MPTIAIDGITVIAAANNTGKSTLGKALYSLLSPFHNYDSNVRDRLVRSVFRAMSQMAPIAIKDSRSSTGVFLEETVSSRTMRVLAEKIVQEVQYGSERSEEDVSAGFLNIATQDDDECKKNHFRKRDGLDGMIWRQLALPLSILARMRNILSFVSVLQNCSAFRMNRMLK